MNTLLIGICESSTADTELMIQYLKIAEACLSMNFKICTYSTGKALLNSFCPIFDIIFLNLPLSDIDSTTLVEQLRQRDAHLSIILTAETNEFFSVGYEYSAQNYFVKPLWYSKILNELKKYLANQIVFSQPHLWISNHQGDYKIYLHKLQYIETSNRKLIFHYGSELLSHNGSLNDLERKFLDCNFFRCNNSYIVNINYIEKIVKDISRYSIHLITGEVLPLSRNKKRVLAEMLRTHNQ